MALSVKVVDLDGTVVNTDDLLVEPDEVPPPEQKTPSVIPDDHILTPEEKFDLEVVLGKHSDVFVAMAIQYKDG